MHKVLVFKETLLPPSETFILAQLKFLRNFKARIAGLERCRPSLPIPNDPILLTHLPASVAALRAKAYRKVAFAPLFHFRVRAFGPGLVHAHFASGGRTAVALANKLGVPLIVTLHGSDVTVRNKGENYYSRLAEKATCFICVSKFIRERALEIGFPAKKLIVHHIGIDRERFSPSPALSDAKKVLFIGRLVEKKGCEYLLRAMQLVQREHSDCELSIIGDGPLRTALVSLAKELQIRCRFLGVQPADVVRDALRNARVLCAPSVTAANGDTEGLPTVIAEAQAAGLPVVGTIHAGIPEIVISEKTGFLVAERDYESLAGALARILSDDQLCERFRHAAVQNIAEHFDLRIQTAVLEQIYESVLSS
jgi:colanic acid/amylovoran biosynthesis glycosyltransferase